MYFLSQPGHGTKDEFLLIEDNNSGPWKQDGRNICVTVDENLTPVHVAQGEFSKEISLNKTFDDILKCDILMGSKEKYVHSGVYDAEGMLNLLKMIDIQSLERNLKPSSDISLLGKLVSSLLLDYKQTYERNLLI